MAEYVNNKEETINVDEPIIFENKTEASFDVSVGVVFRKSGLYRVSVYGNNVSVQKEPERIKSRWIKHNMPNNTYYYDCFLCGCVAPCTETADSYLWKLSNFCPDCGADMRGRENENKTSS